MPAPATARRAPLHLAFTGTSCGIHATLPRQEIEGASGTRSSSPVLAAPRTVHPRRRHELHAVPALVPPQAGTPSRQTRLVPRFRTGAPGRIGRDRPRARKRGWRLHALAREPSRARADSVSRLHQVCPTRKANEVIPRRHMHRLPEMPRAERQICPPPRYLSAAPDRKRGPRRHRQRLADQADVTHVTLR